MRARTALLWAMMTFPAAASAAPPDPVQKVERDGSHDFDFLIGNWKAHVRRLPDRLVGSTKWDV